MSLKNIRKLIKSANNELSIPEMFVNDVEMAIKKLEIEDNRKPSKSYKPSSLKCIRQMYFQKIGAELDPADPSPNLVGICESGTDRHERLQNVISQMQRLGFDIEWLDVGEYIKDNNIPDIEIIKKEGFETKLYHKKLKLRFLCDGIIKYKGKLYVLEIKTESCYKFLGREDVAIEHKNQAAAYSLTLLIGDVMFLYENRNDCKKLAFVLEVTDVMRERLVKKLITDCEKYVKNKCVPPKPKDISNKVCQYCDYQILCSENK